MKKPLFLVLLALPPALAGVSVSLWARRAAPAAPAVPATRYSVLATQKLVHPNGLSLNVARSLKAHKQPSGWSISARPASRYDTEVQVGAQSGRAPSGQWPESRRIGSREIRFRQEVAPAGGASGDDLILSIQAWEASSRGHVLYLFSAPESDPDSADLLWHVAEGTTLSQPQPQPRSTRP